MLLLSLLMGFMTGITTLLFGFGGGFVVVPFVYQLVSHDPVLAPKAMHIAVATSTAIMIGNASYASWQHYKNKQLLKETIIPIIYFIALGSIAGAFIASMLPTNLIHILFMAYIAVTIADCILRRGFLTKQEVRPLNTPTLTLGGTLIGVVATMLGVGGSVMTVPLLRRRGYAMKYATSAANPLSIPVALMGSMTYILLGYSEKLGAGYLGFINLKVLMAFIAAGVVGMIFAKKILPPIKDTLHAKIYIALLMCVLLAMCF